MFTFEWIRSRLARRAPTSRASRRKRFHERLQATLAVKPLESRLVLSATDLTQIFLSDGNLRIADASINGGHNENIRLQADTTLNQLIITDNGTTFETGIEGAQVTNNGHTVILPLNLISGNIQVDGFGGNDTLTLDYSLGNFVVDTHLIDIEFNGGDPTTLPGDRIVLQGGSFASIVHNFTSKNDGSIQVADNGLVTYTGLEPIVDNMSAVDRVFNFNGGSETITMALGSAVGSGLANSIQSTAGESVAFANPTNSLTINAGDGDDVVQVVRLGSGFAATLNINGGSGNDAILISNLEATAISAANSDMTFSAESVTFEKNLTARSIEVITDQIDIAATVTANGGITLLTDDPTDTIGLGSGSGTFQLSQTELTNLASNSTVIIGRTDGTGALDINGVNLTAENFNLTLRAGETTFNGALSLRSGKTLLLETGAISSPHAGTDVTIAGSSLLNIVSTGAVGSVLDPLTFSVSTLRVDTSSGNHGQFLQTPGSVTLTATGLNAGTDAIRLLGGTFTLGGSERVADASTLIVDGSTLAAAGNSETVGALQLITGSITGTAAGTITSLDTIELESGTITAVLAGSVDVRKSTAGIVTLSRAATYTGDTRIDGGTFKLGLANVIPNIADGGDVIIASGATLDLSGLAETINGLSGSAGSMVLNSAANTVTFTVGDNGATTTFAGSINGGINLVKTGSGTLSLDGAIGYTGTTTINGGRLLINGSKTGAGNISVASGGTLGGVGSLIGNLSVAAGGKIDPGKDTSGELVGTLSTANVTFVAGSTFRVDINGTLVAGVDYDQLNVTGTVTLNNTTLDATGLSVGPGVTEIVLINNDGTDAINGTFRDGNGVTLAEGSLVEVNGQNYRLSYKGGTGNDVVLSADTAITVEAGNLVIRDVGTPSADSLTIQVVAGGFQISDPNLILATDIPTAVRIDAHTIFVPIAAFAGEIEFFTQGGNDQLTVDFSGGNFTRVINYDGGTQTSSPGDILILVGGGTFNRVRHGFINASDGLVNVTGNAQINYVGLEPIIDNLDAVNREFDFFGGSQTITVELGSAIGSGLHNSIRSTLGESVAFNNPTGTLVINGGTGDDTIRLLRLDSSFDADVTINGNLGNDIIDATTFAAGSLTINGDAGNDNITVRSAWPIPVTANGGGGNDNRLTVETTDQNLNSPLFSFAGFVFDDSLAPDVATPVPVQNMLPGGDGVSITAVTGGATGVVNFPTANKTIGRLLGAAGPGARAVNLPSDNNGTTVRSAIELTWSGGGTLENVAGDDFVIYESSSNPNGPDAFMVQVFVVGQGWTKWRYEIADSRENYPSQGTSGAFATAFNISDFGDFADGVQISAIRIASMTDADRIAGTGVETGIGTGQFRGEGFVIPNDGGQTSDVLPDPGDAASFDFFGSATFDPDPLYVGVLNSPGVTGASRDDLVKVNDTRVEVTNQGVTRPDIFYNDFGTLSINTLGGTDQIEIQLGGSTLPGTINVDGGSPATADKVIVFGNDSIVDDLTLLENRIADNNTGKNIFLAGVEKVVIDVRGDAAGDAHVDLVTIERTFTLPGRRASIDVQGDVQFDRLVVNTEPPATPPSGNPSITIGGGTFNPNSTPDVFTHLDNGVVLPGGYGAIANNPAFSSGSSPFPGGTFAGYDGRLSIGQLAFGGTGSTTRFLNMPAGDNGASTRSVFQLTWSGARTLTDNGVGTDFVIYESGSAGDPEPFMVQVHSTTSTENGGWSQWFYFPASTFNPATSSFTTNFDLSAMGMAGQTIDAIRVANMTDADRMASGTRVGQVLPGIGGNAFPRPLPGPTATNPNGNFSLGSLDPDIIYVGVAESLNQPPNSGATQDIVKIDGKSVNITGYTPISYAGLDQVLVDTGSGSDQITVTPSTETRIVIEARDPELPTYGGDRLFFELAGTTNPELNVEGVGSGRLIMGNRATVAVRGIETFGVVPGPDGSETPFTVNVSADSTGTSNRDDGNDDTFKVVRNDTNDNTRPTTEIVVNGTLVFRGDRGALNELNIDGSTDNDSVSVDFSRGDPIPAGGIHFDGGGGAGLNDLSVVSGTVNTVTHDFTGAETGTISIDTVLSNNQGVRTFATSLITYENVTERIVEDLLTMRRVLNFSAADDHLRILDDLGGANNDRSRVINGTATKTFTGLIFRNPVKQFVVNANGGDDILSLEAVDLNYRAQTILNGGAGNDSMLIDSNGTAAGGTVDFVVFEVQVHGGGQTGDKLFINDESDVTGDSFIITENEIGGTNVPPGSAAGTPGTAGIIDWNNILPTFVTGMRPEVDEQTILHWLFDEGSGTVVNDGSVNGNDGTISAPPANAPTFVFDVDRGDNVLRFDGVNDFATFQHPNFDIGSAGTFSTWVKMEDLGRRNAFLNTSDTFPGLGMQFEFRQNNNGEIYAYLNKTGSADNSLILQQGGAPVQIAANTWTNIQFTWDFASNTAHIYIGGTEVAYYAAFDQTVAGWTTPIDTMNALFQLGRHREDNSRFFDGSMDDIAFYDRALSTTELADVRNGNFTAGGIGSDLLAYWSLDNATGTLSAQADLGILSTGPNAIKLNTGSPVGGPTFVIPSASGLTLPGSGTQLPALRFDGDGDKIVVPDSASLDFDKDKGTIAFWINPSGELIRNTINAGSTTLFEDTTQQIEVGILWRTDGGEALGHEDFYGRLYFSPNENSLSDSTNIIVSNTRLVEPGSTLPANEWTHVTITWDFSAPDGQQAHIYINGQDDGAFVNNLPEHWTSVAGDTGNWVVGGDAGTNPLNRDFEGQLADVTILGTSLNPEQVDNIFRNGAEATNAFDRTGVTAKFTWDTTNLYGRLDGYPMGTTTANGPFNGGMVEIYDATGTTLLHTQMLSGVATFYEFAIPFANLNGFDPAAGGSLQYRVTVFDADNTATGFDSIDTTLGFTQPPIAGNMGRGVLNFTETQTFFGLGGRVQYDGFADLDITTGSGNETIRIQDNLNSTGDPLANAKSTFTLRTGDGNDSVTIESIDADFSAAVTILGQGGTDTITQLADLNLGSAVSTGNLLYIAESINLGANLSSTGGTATYNGAITLLTNVRIDTDRLENDVQGGAILFTNNTTINSEFGETNNLILDAGSASIRFNADIGTAAGGALGRFEVEQAMAGVIFGASDTVAGDLGPVANVRTDGVINIGSQQVIGGAGIVFNGGIGNSFTMATAGANVRLNGAVTLSTNVVIDTDLNNAQGGNITFTNDSPINSFANEQNDLYLDAGTAAIFFNEDLGNGSQGTLGSLIVEEADSGVVFGQADTEVVGSGGQGAVNFVKTTTGIDLGTGANVIGGLGIVLNGGAALLSLSSVGTRMRFNGAVTLRSDVDLNTGLGTGDILFTNDSPIDSQAGETSDLTLSADNGNVLFNEDLGSSQRLGSLIVTAANQIVFGQADNDPVGTGTTGSVNIVATNERIVLGLNSPITNGIKLNGGASLLSISTTGDNVTFNGATELRSDVRIDTDPNNTRAVAGNILFTAVSPLDSAAGENNDLTLDAGRSNINFNAIIGGARGLGDLTVEFANNVDFAEVIRTSGNVVQLAGTGTTSLHGTLGTGIGGELRLKTNEIALTEATVTTVGNVDLDAANQISLLTGGGLTAGNSTIRIAANQDDTGSSRFVQDASAILRTNNQTANAVRILVGGTGDAAISDLRAGTTGGGITIIAGGGILDNSPTEAINIRAFQASLTAQDGIGGGTAVDADIDTAVAELAAPASRGNINIDELDDLILTGVLTSTGRVDIESGGVLRIRDNTSVTSVTGRVSNAPPLLRFREANPNDVLIPGDPTQDIAGTIGGVPGTGDNLELARNLTLVVVWGDGVVSRVTGLNAGDTLRWAIGPNGESRPIITPNGTGTGPINVFITRTYPLKFLQGVTDTEVVSNFTVLNDSQIALNDVRAVNLNLVGPLPVATSISNLEFRPPPIIVTTNTITPVEQTRPNLIVDIIPYVDSRTTRYQVQEFVEDEKKEEVAQLYLVRVGPDGQEEKRVGLPISELQDLSRLLNRLEKAPIPNGLYRIYHQEPGLPARKILEFRKTGSAIGDPIREPGRGSNPLDLPAAPAVERDGAAPPAAGDPGAALDNVLPREETAELEIANSTVAEQVRQALAQAEDASFTRAARWRRSLVR